jgi:hypothetical protein
MLEENIKNQSNLQQGSIGPGHKADRYLGMRLSCSHSQVSLSEVSSSISLMSRRILEADLAGLCRADLDSKVVQQPASSYAMEQDYSTAPSAGAIGTLPS